MSDGGGRSKKSDEFGHAVARIAVAQVCESAGFHGSHQSALDVLAKVATRLICDIGKAASSSANTANRTESNVLDMIQGLENLGCIHGFSGASDVYRCLVSSGVVKEILQFMKTENEVPFARSVPKVPIVRHRKPIPGFAQIGENPAGNWDHIPDWLPPCPDPRTYTHTSVRNERENELRAERIEQEQQRRKAEESLLGLQRRLICNGEGGPMLPAADIIGRNPFFVPPLTYGEKPVSDIVVPGHSDASRKGFAAVETFALAIEAAKEGYLECERRVKVRFRIGTGRKTLQLHLSSESLRSSDSLCLRDDEKDVRKKSAERILIEAMENGKELNDCDGLRPKCNGAGGIAI